MNMGSRERQGDMIISLGAHAQRVFSPRLLLCGPEGVLFVRHRGWWGLPGGKVRWDEWQGDIPPKGTIYPLNYFTSSLQREVWEECGCSLPPICHIGDDRVITIDSGRKIATEIVSPLFFGEVARHEEVPAGGHVGVFPLTHLPSPLFPDARRICSLKRSDFPSGIISPPRIPMYVQMHPDIQVLFSPPPWAPSFIEEEGML